MSDTIFLSPLLFMSDVMQFIRELVDSEGQRREAPVTPSVRGMVTHTMRIFADKPEDPYVYLVQALIGTSLKSDICVLLDKTNPPKDGEWFLFQYFYEQPMFLEMQRIVAVDNEEKEDERLGEAVSIPTPTGGVFKSSR